MSLAAAAQAVQVSAFPSAYAKRWGEKIPDSRVEIVPECGHVPAVEKPEITAKEISRLYAGTR